VSLPVPSPRGQTRLPGRRRLRRAQIVHDPTRLTPAAPAQAAPRRTAARLAGGERNAILCGCRDEESAGRGLVDGRWRYSLHRFVGIVTSTKQKEPRSACRALPLGYVAPRMGGATAQPIELSGIASRSWPAHS